MEELLLSAIECAWGQQCQAGRNTAESLVPEHSPFEVEIAIEKL